MSVRFNGSNISDRAVIFHNEISRTFRESNLRCQSSTTVASWHYPNGTAVAPLATSTDDYLQIQTQIGSVLIRNKVNAADINPLNNGLWTCRLGDEFVPVGIYQRGGKCSVHCVE